MCGRRRIDERLVSPIARFINDSVDGQGSQSIGIRKKVLIKPLDVRPRTKGDPETAPILDKALQFADDAFADIGQVRN